MIEIICKKTVIVACWMSIIGVFTSFSYAAPKKKPSGDSSNSTKPVRKGTLGLIGQKSEVHNFHRQFICYDTYEMLGHPNETRYPTPESRGYNPVDYTHEAFSVGVKYQGSSQDKNPAFLQSRKFEYAIQYQVEVGLGGQDIRDATQHNPRAASAVRWMELTQVQVI